MDIAPRNICCIPDELDAMNDLGKFDGHRWQLIDWGSAELIHPSEGNNTQFYCNES
jgi:hypothetical protein